MVFWACSLPASLEDVYDEGAVERRDVQKNTSSYFGTIDPDHDWISTTRGTVTITADAPLDDIVKVQVLTESPFFNDYATVLNEATVRSGQTVQLCFDTPSHYDRLIAACVSSKGIYYIKGFNVGQQSVSFQQSEAQARATAPQTADMPALASLLLEEKNACQSYNAMRTILANEAAASEDNDLKNWVKTNHIDLWKGKGWENERLWGVSDQGSTTTWKVVNHTIVRNIDPIDDEEKALLKDIFSTYLNPQYVNGKRPDNLKKIRNNPLFEMEKNYLVSDGVTPITITPVQMNSSEIGSNHIYYYYFNPADIAGMTKEQEVQYMKNLPKYKAIQCQHTKSAAKVAQSEFFKVHEYLLPYYGDGMPADGQTAQAYAIPKGYRVGFMIRKLRGSQDTKNNNIVKAVNNGCCYGDGRLNVEINNFPGHFGSAKTVYSMQDEDPRVAIFGANGRTYMTFEDGSDCNFCDMIVEVGGFDVLDQPQEVDNNVYTLCFEDNVLADYDMNDVVIKARRIDQTHVSYSLVACGGWDELYIRGINGQTLGAGTEVHALFGVATNKFVNTVIDDTYFEPVEDIVEVPASFSFLNYDALPYLYDKTTNREIRLSIKGEDPHAILIPTEFMYPVEKTCIKDAYPQFKNWAQNRNSCINWYEEPQTNKIYVRE